jgi:hypothetical protein
VIAQRRDARNGCWAGPEGEASEIGICPMARSTAVAFITAPAPAAPSNVLNLAAMAPGSPGRGPWPILAVAVTATLPPGFPIGSDLSTNSVAKEHNIAADARSKGR